MSHAVCPLGTSSLGENATIVLRAILALMPPKEGEPPSTPTPQELIQALDDELSLAILTLPYELAKHIEILSPLANRKALAAWLFERDQNDAYSRKLLEKRRRRMSHGRR